MTTNPCCLDVLLSDVFKRQSCHRMKILHVGCDPAQALPVDNSTAYEYGGRGRAEGGRSNILWA